MEGHSDRRELGDQVRIWQCIDIEINKMWAGGGEGYATWVRSLNVWCWAARNNSEWGTGVN